MKKSLLIAIILFFAMPIIAVAQSGISISVPQYYVYIQRAEKRASYQSSNNTPYTFFKLSYLQYAGGSEKLVDNSTSRVIYTSDSTFFYDTIPVINNSLSILRYQQLYWGDTLVPVPCLMEDGKDVVSVRLSDSCFDTLTIAKVLNDLNINPDFPYYDTSIIVGTSSIKVRVRPNNDLTYNLPTHDKAIIKIDTSGISCYQELQFRFSSTEWQNFPYFPYNNQGNQVGSIQFSAIDILPNTYSQYIDSTISIRAICIKNSNDTLFSRVVPFTIRLSAPHIDSISSATLKCYNGIDGGIKVYFDRQLLAGERINILLKDTAKLTDYSVFNIDKLSPIDNSYSIQSGLPAGTYYTSLIGKINYQANYDTIIKQRDTIVKTYKAANSVYFDDGFETPEIDSFSVLIDFSGLSSLTYTGGIRHATFARVAQPPIIEYSVSRILPVICHGGNNGAVDLLVKGGVGDYTIYWFKSGDADKKTKFFPVTPIAYGQVLSIDTLVAGDYYFSIHDKNGCYRKDSLGREIYTKVSVPQPAKPLTFDVLDISQITSVDSANGKIFASFTGGSTTREQNFTYRVDWLKDSLGTSNLLATRVFDTTDTKYEINFNHLDSGFYRLRVTDYLYSTTNVWYNQTGCYAEATINLRRPDSLKAGIIAYKPITCSDSTNGSLLAKVSGGVPIDTIRYVFKWYKVVNGVDVLLSGNTDSILQNVAEGIYKVQVLDKFNNQTISTPFNLTKPLPISYNFAVTAPTCYSSPNGGAIITNLTGGTGKYTFDWSNASRSDTLQNVPGGIYAVIVRDSFYCSKFDTVVITSPVRVQAAINVSQITCRNKCDGQASVINPSGGSAPYTYSWSTGDTTGSVLNLCAGTYWVKVFDSNGCYDSLSVVLDNPDTIALNIGRDRSICLGQTIKLDATVKSTIPVSYQWSGANGFTSTQPKVDITQAGTYVATVTNTRNCIVTDTISFVPINDSIMADFIVSSQAFAQENTVLVNISNPKSDSVVWVVPTINAVQLLNSSNTFCELKFPLIGNYTVGMKAFYRNGCEEEINKNVVVVDKDPFNNIGSQANAFLKRFTVYPNPNNANFKVDLEFNNITQARLRLINLLSNQVVDERKVQGLTSYTLDYNHNGTANITSGTYILVIETARGNFVYKVIITK
jgi:hypothetical protein